MPLPAGRERVDLNLAGLVVASLIGAGEAS
jgi:hypothetical protein